MGTYTPEQWADHVRELERDLERQAARETKKQAELGRQALHRASNANGGVKPSQGEFKYAKAGSLKSLRATGGVHTAVIIGTGFAVLDEYGSAPYTIKPRKVYNARGGKKLRGIDRRALAAARYRGYVKTVLANKASGFIAAGEVPHPGQKARHYVAGAVRWMNANAWGGFQGMTVKEIRRNLP